MLIAKKEQLEKALRLAAEELYLAEVVDTEMEQYIIREKIEKDPEMPKWEKEALLNSGTFEYDTKEEWIEETIKYWITEANR